MIGRSAVVVELDAPSLAARVDKARQETGAVNADLAAGEITRDRREPVLLAQAILAPREAECREGTDDHEHDCNGPHLGPRIGTDADTLERLALAAGDGADYSDLRVV